MSVVYGFLTIMMLLLLAYSFHRTAKTRSLPMLIPVSFQLFALVLIFLCFINDVEAVMAVEALFIVCGIIPPLIMLASDYRRMLKILRCKGCNKEMGGKVPSDELPFPEEGINDIEGLMTASEILAELKELPEEVRMNFIKSAAKAEIYLKSDEPAAASSIYETLLMLTGKAGSLYYNYGCICYRQALFEKALDSFKKSLELYQGGDAGKRRIFYNLGNSSYMTGRFADAAKYYERSLQISPGDPGVLENLSYTYFRLGNEAKGIEILRKIEADKGGYRPHYVWGRLLAEAGRFEEAEAELRKAAKLKPDSIKTLEELGNVLMKAEKPDEAIAIYSELLQMDPGNYSYWYKTANAYTGRKRWKDAVSCYREALRIRPESYMAYYGMAVALEETGDRKAAVKAYEKAKELCPDFIDAYNSLGVELSLEGRLEEAIEVFEDGIKRSPGESGLYSNLGICLMENGRYIEAAGAFRTALDLMPEKTEIYFWLGAALTEMSHYNDAAEAYASAFKAKPADGEIHYNLASVYAMLGRYDTALEFLKRAVESNIKFIEDIRNDCAFDGMRSRVIFKTMIS